MTATVDTPTEPATPSRQPSRRWIGFGIANLVIVLVLAVASWYLLADPTTSPWSFYPLPFNAALAVLVLAVAQDAGPQDNKPRVVNAVTLEVTPQEAERMDLARSVGTLSLVLRSQNDTAPVATQGARKRDVLLAEAPAPETPRVRHAPPPAAREERPEVLRGVKASTQ